MNSNFLVCEFSPSPASGLIASDTITDQAHACRAWAGPRACSGCIWHNHQLSTDSTSTITTCQLIADLSPAQLNSRHAYQLHTTMNHLCYSRETGLTRRAANCMAHTYVQPHAHDIRLAITTAANMYSMLSSHVRLTHTKFHGRCFKPLQLLSKIDS